MPTLSEVRAFISELPDVVSVAALQEAATNRLIQLDAAKRPVITPGRTARIGTTITPACLRLLTGTVQQPNRTRSRFDFLLDEASTERLRRDPSNTRFRVADGEKRYRLAKVPAACIELTDQPGRLLRTPAPGGSRLCCPRGTAPAGRRFEPGDASRRARPLPVSPGESRGTHGHLPRRRCSRPNVRQRHERCAPARAVTRRPGQRPAEACARSRVLPGDG
ncbi:hypothetical protein [Streptomyces sp.]|uniref:hypothetical protein n=1 Tax=Streptomyces sp. TaxID=1931 RepID=UPI00281172FB|nr:hypothetical protein [Streptomyces sp.]